MIFLLVVPLEKELEDVEGSSLGLSPVLKQERLPAVQGLSLALIVYTNKFHSFSLF